MLAPVNWLSDFERLLVRVLNALVALSLIGLAGTMTVQVFLRYVVHSSFLGVEEISTLFGLWLYYAGLPLVTARDEHIRGGLLSGALSPSVSRAMKLIFTLAVAAICACFFVISSRYLIFIFEGDRRSTFLRWPSFLWAASLCLGLGLSSMISLIHTVRLVGRR